MSSRVHYEVFVKKNRKAGWVLERAEEVRDEAFKLAHELLARNPDGSVRISKEVYNEADRTFRSVPVFNGGNERMTAVKEKTGEARLPCLAPDDLCKSHGRDTIRRVLKDWLERKQAIPLELLHRPDLAESLEASGTELQHAVQKVAVANARDSDASVHGFVKQANELVQKTLTRLYTDHRNKVLPQVSAKHCFGKVAAEIHASDSRPYRLRAAIASMLKSNRNYADKLNALLSMSQALAETGEVREFALCELDQSISDVMQFDAGREALLGECRDLGERLERLTCLYDGDDKAEAISMSPDAARQVAEMIQAGDLPACKIAIAQALLADLESPRRLRPSSVREEVRLARELAQKLVMSADSSLPIDALTKSFTARSARLLQPETIDQMLQGADSPVDQIQRLFTLEENIVGAPNKRKLAGYIRSVVGGHPAESWFVRGQGSPLERLAILARFQADVRQASYPDEDQSALSQQIDALGMKLIQETRVFDAIEAGQQSVLDRANGFLRLATGGALPHGDCLADAQARALRLIKSEAGLSEAEQVEGRPKLKRIKSMLGQLGRQGAPTALRSEAPVAIADDPGAADDRFEN